MNNYRNYLKTLLGVKFCGSTCGSPTAMTRLFECGLVVWSDWTVEDVFDDDEYKGLLEGATRAFGGTVATFVHYNPVEKWHVVAVFQSDVVVVTKKARLSFHGQRMTVNDKELTLSPDSPTLFRVCTWIARTVFDIQDKSPFPLLEKRSVAALLPKYVDDSVGYEMDTTMVEALQQMDMIITSTAHHSKEFDCTEATIVEILNCFGVIYVGSVNEVMSDAETYSIHYALKLGRLEGYTHLWWIEDSTLLEDDQFNLVYRFSIDNKPYYIKRKLKRFPNNLCRFKDQVTGRTSCALEWDFGRSEVGFLAFNEWVESFLPRKARAMPYMRREIVDRYAFVKPLAFKDMVRPFLVNGVEGTLPTMYNTDLPSRLFYSPDLFVEKSKIPEGLHPTTVHFQVDIKPWIETCDMQLFVQVDGDTKHAYRVLHHKDGVFLPEPGQLKAFVDSDDPNSLGQDALQMVVLKRTLAPCGAITMEFILTTYQKSFRIYVDNQMCDYNVRYTIFPYRPEMSPQVFGGKDLLVFTKKLTYVQKKHGYPSLDDALPKALQLIEKEGPQRIPLLFAFSNVEDNTYKMEMI